MSNELPPWGNETDETFNRHPELSFIYDFCRAIDDYEEALVEFEMHIDHLNSLVEKTTKWLHAIQRP